MKIVKPYIDEKSRVIFIEFENDTIHNIVNGFLFGLLVWGIGLIAISLAIFLLIVLYNPYIPV